MSGDDWLFAALTAGFAALVAICVGAEIEAQPIAAQAAPPYHLTSQQRAARAQAMALKIGINSATPPAAPTIGALQVLEMAPAATPLGQWKSVGPTIVLAAQAVGPNGFCPVTAGAAEPTVGASGRATALAFGAGGALYLGTAGVMRRRYVAVLAASIFLALAATQSGCGGDSSSITPLLLPAGSSSLIVTQVWVSQSPGSLAVTGLPAALGKVTLLK